ncbi:GNAT family N-acetyltransferase [Cohnella panacarvi]|uniref:GNAT family N-acetyltransferase n=1 Tax=Cohnella panacarvi TaxID=400776 RepID=UPI00047BC6F7|nr:GNAT family N-acetyltransferase [Cohnella panacarvi]
MNHAYVIRTERLRLRQLELSDLELVLLWRNDPAIRQWFLSSGTITWEQHRNWYARYLENGADIAFIAEDMAGLHEPVGIAALYRIDASRGTAEFGRLMVGNARAKGKGFGLEIVGAICAFGFERLGLNAIDLEVYEHNAAAIKIYEKAGFRTVGAKSAEQGPVRIMTLPNQGG